MYRFASLCSLPLWVVLMSPVLASDDDGDHRARSLTTGASDVGIEADLPLASKDFSVRRRSTFELWRERDRYREAVLNASRSEDLEAAERARWVLGRWQRGILVDTPPELAKQLSERSPVEAIELLLETGNFSAATVAMQEAHGTLDFEVISARVSITLDQRFPIYARNAVVHDQTAALGKFLDAASSTKEMAVCWDDWSRLFSEPKETGVSPQLPYSAKWWSPELAEQTQCLLHLLAGNFDQAMKVALQSDRELQKREAGIQGNVQGNLDEKNDGPEAASGDNGSLGLLSQKQQPLTRVVRIVTSQWAGLADAAASSARAFERATERLATQNTDRPSGHNHSAAQIALYRAEAIRHWSDALIAADRCGDESIREAAVQGLVKHQSELDQKGVELADLASVRSLAWRTLLIHGELDAVLNLIGTTDPKNAATIASETSRNADAFRLLGFPADEIDIQLEPWIDNAITAQRELHAASTSEDPIEKAEASTISDTGMSTEIEQQFELIRLLDDVSRDDAAWRIVDRLSARDLIVKHPRRGDSFLVREYVLLALMYTAHSDWMIRLTMRPWETEPTDISLGLISRIMISEDRQLIELLMRYVKIQRPKLLVHEQFRIACEIARAGENDRRLHRELVATLSQSLRDGSLRRAITQESQYDIFFEPTTKVWADLFAAHGRPDLAEPFLQQQAAAGDLKAAFTLAKEYRLAGSTPANSDIFESIWEAVAASQSDESTLIRDDVMTAVSAVGEQLRTARDVGDLKTAEMLLMQLRAMACTPSTDMRQQIADVLAELGQWQIAEEVYRSLLMITAITSDETQSMIDIARKYQKFAVNATVAEIEQTETAMDHERVMNLTPADLQLRSEAIRWLDLAFAGTLDQVEFRTPLYLMYPQLIAREQLELAITEAVSQQRASAETPETIVATAATEQQIHRLLNRLHDLDQMDITTAESILPKLTNLGLQHLAHEQLAKMLQAATQHMRTFPTDAVRANNVAWGAAVNDFNLPQALQLSRLAVQFEPESAIYRDTLAEILARMGNTHEALAIERGCLIDDPGQWHLHEQVQRFEEIIANSR
jgi:hypothetical protein